MKFLCLLVSVLFGLMAGFHATPLGMDSVQLRSFAIVFLAAAFFPWELILERF